MFSSSGGAGLLGSARA